jgi:urease accessory protein
MQQTQNRALFWVPTRLMDSLPIVGLLLMIPNLALAHVGMHDGHGFSTGAGHPLNGLDHVLAMVTVGIWAALSGRRAVWAMPASFLVAMLAGGVLAAAGIAFPLAEPTILASIIVLGFAAAVAWRPPLMLALAGMTAFGLAHGYAHGVEGSADIGFVAGFLVSTAALHLLGLAVGFGLIKIEQTRAARAIGGAAALVGLGLAFG